MLTLQEFKVWVLTNLEKHIQQDQVWAADVKADAVFAIFFVFLCLLPQNVFKVMVFFSVHNEPYHYCCKRNGKHAAYLQCFKTS